MFDMLGAIEFYTYLMELYLSTNLGTAYKT